MTKLKVTGRRWDTGVLVPGITYSKERQVIEVTPPTVIYRLRSPKMRGDAVLEIQKKLKAKGFDPGPLDSIFGIQTLAAVNAFQLTEGLLSDGEVGPETAEALSITLA